jgi:hypothetical protein
MRGLSAQEFPFARVGVVRGRQRSFIVHPELRDAAVLPAEFDAANTGCLRPPLYIPSVVRRTID